MGTSISRPPLQKALPIILWLVFCVVLLMAVSVCALYWTPAVEHYNITERYLFTSTDEDARVYLGILLPKSGPYQEVKPARVYWPGSINRAYEQDIDVIKLSGYLQKAGSQEAVIEYGVALRQGKITWEATPEAFQTTPQHNIESTHPEIVQAAEQIADGHTRQDVYKIYRFTSELLSRPARERQFIDASALRAYRTRLGSCGEYANLMVALCRATGIPAQTIIGVYFPDLLPFSTASVRSLNHPAESHAWVEFNTDSRWEMADPSCKSHSLLTTGFGRNDGRHLSYGETKQLSEVYASTREWAFSRGGLVGTRFASLKFVASADNEGILVTPRVTMTKGWDGRWFNMLAAWSVTLWLLFRINRKKLLAHSTESDFQSVLPVAAKA